MRSTSETGHAKNVANFEKLIFYVRALGAVYRPSNTRLDLPALETLLANARGCLDKVVWAKLEYDDAVIARRLVFARVKPTATRIINTLIACGAPAAKIEHARALSRQMGGRTKVSTRNTGQSPDPEQAPGTASRKTSASQQSFHARTELFGVLVALATEEPAYGSSEAGLDQTALKEQLKGLYAAEKTFVRADQLWRMALQERDALLYTGAAALLPRCALLKAYLKSLGGVGAPVYKAVSHLRFHRVSS